MSINSYINIDYDNIIKIDICNNKVIIKICYLDYSK